MWEEVLRGEISVIFLANSSENAVRAAAVVRDAVWCDLRIFFSEFIIKKVRVAASRAGRNVKE